MISLKQGGALLFLALLSLPSHILAASAPFEIDLNELERQMPAASRKPEKSTKTEKKKSQKVKKKSVSASGKGRQSSRGDSNYLRYTVKPGDHIFKILVGKYGMSNEAAEALIPEIIRINDISDIKNMKVGRTLLIPKKGWESVPGPSKEELTQETGEKSGGASRKGGVLGSAKLRAPEPRAPEPRAPEPRAPAPEPRAPEPRAPEPRAETFEPSAAAAAPRAPMPAAPAAVIARPPAATSSPAPPVAPPVVATTWFCSVPEKDSGKMVDAILNALSIPWSRNRIIQSDLGAANAYSIRVDRYFDYKGGRYLVSFGESDAYSYTLMRILLSAGYHVLWIDPGEELKSVGEKLLRLVGVVAEYGNHALPGGKETTGFLVNLDEAGRRVLITREPADPLQRWAMKPGCSFR